MNGRVNCSNSPRTISAEPPDRVYGRPLLLDKGQSDAEGRQLQDLPRQGSDTSGADHDDRIADLVWLKRRPLRCSPSPP